MTALEPIGVMSAWPALMNAETAALYLEVSAGSFRGLARRAAMRPVDLGMGLTRWRKADIDEFVAALPIRGAGARATHEALDFDTALARSASRTRRSRYADRG